MKRFGTIALMLFAFVGAPLGVGAGIVACLTFFVCHSVTYPGVRARGEKCRRTPLLLTFLFLFSFVTPVEVISDRPIGYYKGFPIHCTSKGNYELYEYNPAAMSVDQLVLSQEKLVEGATFVKLPGHKLNKSIVLINDTFYFTDNQISYQKNKTIPPNINIKNAETMYGPIPLDDYLENPDEYFLWSNVYAKMFTGYVHPEYGAIEVEETSYYVPKESTKDRHTFKHSNQDILSFLKNVRYLGTEQPYYFNLYPIYKKKIGPGFKKDPHADTGDAFVDSIHQQYFALRSSVNFKKVSEADGQLRMDIEKFVNDYYPEGIDYEKNIQVFEIGRYQEAVLRITFFNDEVEETKFRYRKAPYYKYKIDKVDIAILSKRQGIKEPRHVSLFLASDKNVKYDLYGHFRGDVIIEESRELSEVMRIWRISNESQRLGRREEFYYPHISVGLMLE